MKSNRKPLLTLHIYRRHIVLAIIIIAAAMFGYGVYFKAYMTLPQSAINILGEIPFSLESQKILVIAPHCDDEALGAAGLIHRALSLGSEVKVVIVTDCNKRKKGVIRRGESVRALELLGVPKENVVFLLFPEAQYNPLARNLDGFFIKQALQNEIDDFKPTLLILPHPKDTHMDHTAAGKAVQEIISEKDHSIDTAYYLIHYNFLKFPSPPGFKPEAYLLPPARLISLSEHWYKFTLTENEEALKEEAVFMYKSQLSLENPILYRMLLDFIRKNELFMIPNH